VARVRHDTSSVVAPHLRLLTAALALAFLGSHIQSLPRSLEDIDSINFALGVESFDVAAHRPHPPGYPVFVAMARVSTATVAMVAPALDRNERAAVGLAIWGVLAGTVFTLVLVSFWIAMGWSPVAAWFAAALAMASPLFWFTSARPLTDALALVAAVAVQWMLVRDWPVVDRPLRLRPLLIAACLAGVLIGVRTQTMWLTGPLLAWIAVVSLSRHGWPAAGALAGAAAFGCLLWAVPLVVSTGGIGGYVTALAGQGQEDFSGVEMLATSNDGRLLGEALSWTFKRPWRVAWLGDVMNGLALIGLFHLAWRRRRTFGVVVLAFAPYLVFHLAFHETETVRYALPLVVPMAGLAVHGLFLLPIRAAVVVAALVAAASLVTAQQSLRSYGGNVLPTFLAFRDAGREARARADAPLVVAHTGMRRVADWYRAEWPELPAMGPREPSWLRIIEHFRTGMTNPVWFLTDRRRTDVVLFDPRARRVVREYVQDLEVRRLVGQTRQDEVRWWEILRPGWMLGRGWALSPEVAGVTFSTGRDPLVAPAEGYLLRSDAPRRLMIGGRYLGGGRTAAIAVEIDGRPVSRWEVTPSEPHFLQWVELPGGVLNGDGAYAVMQVRVEDAGGSGAAPRIGLEQFDFASTGDVMTGFAAGWQEPETELETGRSWRWAGPRATLVAYAGAGAVRLILAGESPLRYFARPSNIVVLVNDREAGRFAASADFEETITVPAGYFTASPSRVTIETDQMFVPAERGDTPDHRQLAQRFFRIEAVPADSGSAGP
jgi:hypothetical protein